jgi:hypothetical protein
VRLPRYLQSKRPAPGRALRFARTAATLGVHGLRDSWSELKRKPTQGEIHGLPS